MPEGLHHPNHITLPPAVRAALPGVVRVYTRIRFHVTLYPTQEQVDAARQAPGAYDVRYRPDGGVIWPLRLSLSEWQDLRNDPLRRIQAGLFEVVRDTAHLDPPQLQDGWEGETKAIGGGATGFVVGRHAGRALIATNYHLAREAIGRLQRQAGQYTPKPAPTQDVRLGVSQDNHSTEHIMGDVQLVAHGSARDWGAGLDWALLSIPEQVTENIRPLPLSLDAHAGMPVWAAGFPARTQRNSPQYPEADSTLRISTGALTRPEIEEGIQGWRADLDGLSGSSGSPVMNEHGQVIGIFRNHTHFHSPETGPVDRRFVEFGGEAQLAPVGPLLDILKQL